MGVPQEQYAIEDIHDRGPDDARLVNYGTSVWAIIGHLRLNGWDIDDVARGYEIPVEAVNAALAYYRRYKKYIDARLLLNDGAFGENIEVAESSEGQSMAEETVASEHIYAGKVVKLRVDTVQFEDGRQAKREVVEHSGAVAIVPVDDEGRIVMVRQFRTPVGAELLEVPAGTIDGDEQPEAAVQRELQEEIGYRAGRIRRLAGFWVAPGYCTEFIHVYLAEGLVESRLDADEDEAITVERYTLDELLAQVAGGAVRDAKSIVGLLALARERALPAT